MSACAHEWRQIERSEGVGFDAGRTTIVLRCRKCKAEERSTWSAIR